MDLTNLNAPNATISIPTIAHTTVVNRLYGVFFLVFFLKINPGNTIQVNSPILISMIDHILSIQMLFRSGYNLWKFYQRRSMQIDPTTKALPYYRQ